MNVHSEVRTKRLWEGAFILTIAGLVTKILSAGYRIPYQNIAGDIGFYIYQQVYPIYGIALILSTYGFPVIISKLLAEHLEHQDNRAMMKILYTSFVTLMVIGLTFFSMLYWGADFIAGAMGDIRLSRLVKVISFSFLLLPLISVLRGFFQGKKNMLPTAVSQMVEQFIRVVTIIVMSILLLNAGYGAYEAGAGAIFGSITGGFAAIMILVYFLFKKRQRKLLMPIHKETISSRKIVRSILSQSITICISALLLILFQLIDSFSVYSLLLSGGMDDVLAKEVKGIYDRGQPLIQLGTIVATSLSLSIVPLIAGAKARKDFSFIYEKTSLALRLSIVVGVGASVGLALVLEPTNIMLYENNFGTNVLIIIGFSILFTSVSQTVTAILQGIGKPSLPALSVLIGLFIKTILNVLLVPIFETTGAAIATVIGFGVIMFIQLLMLQKNLPGSLNKWRFLNRVLVATICMIVTITCYTYLLQVLFSDQVSSRIFACFQSLSSVIIGGSIYLIFIIRGRVFSEEEISFIPLGTKGEIVLRSLIKRR